MLPGVAVIAVAASVPLGPQCFDLVSPMVTVLTLLFSSTDLPYKCPLTHHHSTNGEVRTVLYTSFPCIDITSSVHKQAPLEHWVLPH